MPHLLSFIQESESVPPWASICFMAPWSKFLDLLAPAPLLNKLKTCFCNTKSPFRPRGNPECPCFGGFPLFPECIPQEILSLQSVNWHPPKCTLAASKKRLATSNLQFLYRMTQKSPLPHLHFGGCRFVFWRLTCLEGALVSLFLFVDISLVS